MRACWQENPDISEEKNCGHAGGKSILLWRKTKPRGHAGGKSGFSWLGIRSRDHIKRSGTSHLHKILDFLGREPIVLGINSKIGNFKPKAIFLRGFEGRWV